MSFELEDNTGSTSEPIRLHLDNPRYFTYNGNPAVLITAGEFYGAVVNLDFDYISYLDMLKKFGLNLTRLFSGSWILDKDAPGKVKDHTLGPYPFRFIAPWKRSNQDGYINGGCKFDLCRWDARYFERLADFIQQAHQRGIIVEYVLFSTMYNENIWSMSPLNIQNNINGIGKCTWEQFNTLYEEALVRCQEDLVRKVVRELNRFGNVYYEICNEPDTYNNTYKNIVDWHNRMIEAIIDEESRLSKKHLIAVSYCFPFTIRHIHPAVSVHNVHYTYGDQWVGAMELLDNCYDCPRVLAMDETDIFPTSTSATEARVEAWEAIIGGCAVYDHLSWAYTTGNPSGDTEENRAFLSQLQVLKRFIEGFDFIRMKADKSIIASGVYEDAHARVLAEPGRQYAVYVHHGKRHIKNNDGSYGVTEGTYELQLGLWIPEGRYVIEWILPTTGEVLEKNTVAHPGTRMELKSPEYSVDMALKIKQCL